MRTYHGKTSWQKVAPWYSRITDHGQGHYYHQHVVIPKTLALLDLKPGSKILDLACGNGVLAKAIPGGVNYLGIDISASLVKEAQKSDINANHKYQIFDVTKPVNVPSDFTHAAIILALQNVEKPEEVLKNAAKALVDDGVFVIVLNHPVLRIPRQTSWGIDEQRKIEYRRIDRYLSPLKIPINMNPGDRNSAVTWSYHHSISDYSKMLKDAGFVIEVIEEWVSDKESEGKAAKMENRGRSEFPLFMAIKARKK